MSARRVQQTVYVGREIEKGVSVQFDTESRRLRDVDRAAPIEWIVPVYQVVIQVDSRNGIRRQRCSDEYQSAVSVPSTAATTVPFVPM